MVFYILYFMKYFIILTLNYPSISMTLNGPLGGHSASRVQEVIQNQILGGHSGSFFGGSFRIIFWRFFSSPKHTADAAICSNIIEDNGSTGMSSEFTLDTYLKSYSEKTVANNG